MGLKKLKKQNPCVIDRSRDGKTAGSFKVLHRIRRRPHKLANVMSGMAICATLLLSHQKSSCHSDSELCAAGGRPTIDIAHQHKPQQTDDV
jgi:hypothetical protein